MIQLTEWLNVETPLGDGYALLVENGNDDQYWTVILNDSRAIVTFRQKEIRAKRSYTHGRDMSQKSMMEATKVTLANPDDKSWGSMLYVDKDGNPQPTSK